MAGKVCGKSEMAAIFGVTPKTITVWQEEGMPFYPPPSKGEANSYNTLDVIRWRIAREKGYGGGDTLDLDTERARLAKEQADSKAMSNELDRGEMINLEAAMIIVQRSAFAIRQKIINSDLSKEAKQALLVDINSLGDQDFSDVENEDDIEDDPKKEEPAAS